jgi:hypothetical protein
MARVSLSVTVDGKYEEYTIDNGDDSEVVVVSLFKVLNAALNVHKSELEQYIGECKKAVEIVSKLVEDIYNG